MSVFGEGISEEERKAQEQRSAMEQLQFEMEYIKKKLGLHQEHKTETSTKNPEHKTENNTKGAKISADKF